VKKFLFLILLLSFSCSSTKTSKKTQYYDLHTYSKKLEKTEEDIFIKKINLDIYKKVKKDDYKKMFALGLYCYRENKYDLALSFLKNSLKNCKDDFVLPVSYLSKVYILKGEYDLALNILNKYIRKKNTDLLLINKATVYIFKKEYKKAKDLLYTVIKRNNNVLEAKLNLCNIYNLEDKNDLATYCYSKVLKENIKNLKAQSNLINLNTENKSVYLFKKPKDFLDNYNKGLFYLKISNYKKALLFFAKQKSLYPGMIENEILSAYTLAKLGQTEEAIEKYMSLIKKHPQESLTFLFFGELLLRKGDYIKAKKYFEKYIKFSKNKIKYEDIVYSYLFLLKEKLN
jgi:tetratricopeptide (TPR) repeat protein